MSLKAEGNHSHMGYLDKETREKYTKEAIQENTKYLMKHGGTLYNGVEEVIKLLSKDVYKRQLYG